MADGINRPRSFMLCLPELTKVNRDGRWDCSDAFRKSGRSKTDNCFYTKQRLANVSNYYAAISFGKNKAHGYPALKAFSLFISGPADFPTNEKQLFQAS